VAVSLRTEPGWDVDELIVEFTELLSDSTIVEITENVDNLARRTHAQTILARHRARALDQLTHTTFWASRHLIFPNLRFGLVSLSRRNRFMKCSGSEVRLGVA